MFGARLALLSFAIRLPIPAASSALRGRKLQWTGNSNDKVVPECKAGYNDVSGGSAYYWSCAFHCEGGAYFATEGCICACLTPQQETAWRSMVTTTPPRPFSPLNAPTPSSGSVGEAPSAQIYVTTVSTTQIEHTEPVAAIPVGETYNGWTSPTAIDPGYTVPIAPNLKLNASPTVAPVTPEVWRNEALDWPVVTIALAAAGALAGASLLCVLCCNWRLLIRLCVRKGEPSPKAPYATPPVLRLHADPSNKTSPACFVEAPGNSRASSKMSTASGASALPSSRRSSKASTASHQQDTKFLKPRNETNAGIGSIESIASWAHEHRNSLQAPSNFPSRTSRSSSKTSSCSQGQESRLLHPTNPRSSSRNSAASQDSKGTKGTRQQSKNSTTGVVAGVPPRKISKVQPETGTAK